MKPHRLIVVLLLCACDTRDMVHMPTATLERMQEQQSYRPYATNTAFADGRAMRDPPYDSVAMQVMPASQPAPLDQAALQHGRGLFNTFCAVCHGVLGDGHSAVAEAMTIVKPTNLQTDAARAMPNDHLVRVVHDGYGMMGSFAAMLNDAETRRVVAYVRVLQNSQHVHVDALPQPLQQHVREALP